MVNTNSMFLVYQDSEGRKFYQHWEDLTESGTLIDPETGEDLELIGWYSSPTKEEPGSIKGLPEFPELR